MWLQALFVLGLMGLSGALLLASFRLPSFQEAGPGAIPILWAGLLLLCALSTLIQLRLRTASKDPTFRFQNVAKVGGLLAGVGGYLFAMPHLGYFLSTFLFLLFSFYWVSYREYKTLLVVAVGWMLFSYLIFVRLLSIPLPQGWFE